MSSPTSSITVFLPALSFDDEGIRPVTEPLTCSVLIWGNVSNENLLLVVDDQKLNPTNPLPLQSHQIQFSSSFNTFFLPFCMLGSNPNKGGGGVEHRRERLEIGGDRTERTSPKSRRGHFNDNKEC